MVVEPPPRPHCSTLGASQCSVMNTEDLLYEVLLRLPAKSLMRFKCVSKHWYSIVRNPKFAKARSLHSGPNSFRGLLITDFPYPGFHQLPLQPTFFYANLNEPCPIKMSPQFTTEVNHYLFTQVVRGLIGSYFSSVNEFTLCNIATQELLRLPLSPSPYLDDGESPSSESDDDDGESDLEFTYRYFLGFDPVKEMYKVLCLSCCYHIVDEIAREKSHVFTLGVDNSDMEWSATSPPPVDLVTLPKKYLCINGTLYWLVDEQETLTAFHLTSETFATITIPEIPHGCCDLVEICDSPGIVVFNPTTEYVEAFDLLTMNICCTGGGLGGWTRKRVFFPTGLNYSNDIGLYYTGTLPSGEMMLAQTGEIRSTELVLDMFPLPICVYDHHKNEMKSIKLEGYEPQDNDTYIRRRPSDYHHIKICYCEENIISLDCLMNRDETIINN